MQRTRRPRAGSDSPCQFRIEHCAACQRFGARLDGKHARHLRSHDRGNSPALDEGAERHRRLADGGIFDVALFDQTRKPRDIAKGRLDGRSTEIQRLIGRSLRSGGRSGKTWTAHDVGRLRCACKPMAEHDRGDHRRESGGCDGLPKTARGKKNRRARR